MSRPPAKAPLEIKKRPPIRYSVVVAGRPLSGRPRRTHFPTSRSHALTPARDKFLPWRKPHHAMVHLNRRRIDLPIRLSRLGFGHT
jgi:hypothetical protein